VKIVRGYRTELDPTRAQVDLMVRHAAVARWAYNWGLERKQSAYQKSGMTLDAMKLHKELNALKKTDYPWLYSVSKCAAQEALRDLDSAFLNFWRRRRSGKRCGFPRFKSRKRTVLAFRLAPRIYPSSKMCSCRGCGYLLEELALSQRTFQCPNCGCSRDRDLNAALNLRNVAVSSTDTQNACGGDVSPSDRWQLPVNRVSEDALGAFAEERSTVSITLSREGPTARSRERIPA
jgi:transposase